MTSWSSGGCREVSLMADAFPGAPIYTSLYDPRRPIRIRKTRRPHQPARQGDLVPGPCPGRPPVDALRLLVAPPVSRGDPVRSTGWSHGVRAPGRKDRLLPRPGPLAYQTSRYLSGRPQPTDDGRRGREWRWVGQSGVQLALDPAVGPRVACGPSASLRKWDRRAAGTADRLPGQFDGTAAAIRAVYGTEAEVCRHHQPSSPAARSGPSFGVEPGFWLCVSRLLRTRTSTPWSKPSGPTGERLVVVGDGPERSNLSATGTEGAVSRRPGR